MQKIKIKYIFLFQIVFVFIGLTILSYEAIVAMNDVNDKYYDVFYANDNIATAGLAMSSSTTELRLTCTELLLTTGNDDAQYQDFKLYTAEVQENIDVSKVLVEESTLSDSAKTEIMATLNETQQNRENQVLLIDAYMQDFYNGTYVDLDKLFEEVDVMGKAIFTNIDTVNSQTTKFFTAMIEDIRNDVEISRIVLILLSGILIIISTTIMILVSVAIRSSLSKLKDGSAQLAKGNLHVNIAMPGNNEIAELSREMAVMSSTVVSITEDISKMSEELDKGNLSSFSINPDKYEGEFKTVVDGINNTVGSLVSETLDIILALQEINKGNFNIKVIDLPGEKHNATESLVTVRELLGNFTSKILDIVEQVKHGKLDEKIATDGLTGDWLIMCNGISDLMLSVKEPFDDVQEIFEEFAKGNFQHRNNKKYEGVFAHIQSVSNSTAHTVGEYINEISYILNEMANKNFDVNMEQNYVGDFKQIESSIEFIVSNLTSLISDIISTSQSVNTGVKQISDSSIDLAQASTEQASSVEQLIINVKSIDDQAQLNQENATEASDVSTETKENANHSTKQMGLMLESMQGIEEAANSISGIIKIIDDIAFQTNLLALNAAVEAARAGEHGKGFAVVADEVRSLAQRSKEAASETGDLIESTIEKVSIGSSIASETSVSLDKIVEKIDKVSIIIDKVKDLSIKQGDLILDVTTEANTINSVTTQNAANSEELSASSEELSAQAELMLKTVSGFNLKNE